MVSCCPLWDDCSVLFHFLSAAGRHTCLRSVTHFVCGKPFLQTLPQQGGAAGAEHPDTCEEVNLGLYQLLLLLDNAGTAAPSAGRAHFQVATLQVFFCFLLSPLALVGLVPSGLRNELSCCFGFSVHSLFLLRVLLVGNYGRK